MSIKWYKRNNAVAQKPKRCMTKGCTGYAPFGYPHKHTGEETYVTWHCKECYLFLRDHGCNADLRGAVI